MPFTKFPLWKCHAEVRAAKIKEIEPDGTLSFEGLEFTYNPGPAWHNKQCPDVGGYLVIDSTGVAEYRRACKFELEWTQIEPVPA